MGKIIDITGQKFGLLTAIEPSRLNGRFAWKCKCECGNEKIIDSGNLRNNRVLSCGCQTSSFIKQKLTKDIVGQTFNNLTVLEKTDVRMAGAIVWKCQCKCGNFCYVSTGNLKSGHTKSCGCLKKSSGQKLSIIGEVFGKLTVISYEGSKNSETLWKCKCECGNEIIAVGWHLTRGLKNSCGCLKSKGEAKIRKLLDENNISYETQKKFSNCLSSKGNFLYFDFFINNKYLIEYDGEQHFISKDAGWSNEEQLYKTQLYDEIKNEWCKKNNIPLIRIPYTKYDTLTIDDLLLEDE